MDVSKALSIIIITTRIFSTDTSKDDEQDDNTEDTSEDAESIRKQNYLLQNALNDAKIADKSKTDLIATISHDIRSPLTNIIGLSESLTSKKLSNDVVRLPLMLMLVVYFFYNYTHNIFSYSTLMEALFCPAPMFVL